MFAAVVTLGAVTTTIPAQEPAGAPIVPAPIVAMTPDAPQAPIALPTEITSPTQVIEPTAATDAAAAPAKTGVSVPLITDLCSGGSGQTFDWKKVPRVRAATRSGFFPVPQTGPGYYSALDQLRGVCLQAPPKYPYPRVSAFVNPFYDHVNFAYLDDPKNTEQDFFDPLKRIHIGDNWLFNTGGELRYRAMREYNSRLGQIDNNYNLNRARIYGDLWFKDDFRLFAEGLGAWTSSQSLAPLPLDHDKFDFLNLFVDVKVLDINGNPVYVRGGRQELMFGSQRLISPLDWANARRTFQGVRGMYTSKEWDFDVFWTQPVIPNPTRFDSVDNNQNFAGAWATYKPKKGQAVDAYFLVHDNTNVVTQLGIPRGEFTRYTFGGRYSGNQGNFLFDTEAAMQLGTENGQSIVAGMATAGAGYNFKDAPMNPTFWAYYDYASGGANAKGTVHTFNQTFPFGHYYMGWVDQVARSNIHDFNMHLYLYPTPWLTTWVQFHSFWLADKTDALYNAGGNAIRRDATGRAGNHVGEELDLVFNFHLSKHTDFLTGYCYLWGGDFLKNTSSPTAAANTSLFFAQLSYRW